MQIVHGQENTPTTITKSIFLAGPMPRDGNVPDWRPDAIAILEELGYDGTVFTPSPRDVIWNGDYDGQTRWEKTHLDMADVILFWVPRDQGAFIGLTTNVEFGEYLASNRIIYGRPDGAYKTRYLDIRYKNTTHQEPFNDLRQLCIDAMMRLGKGATRHNGECRVPLMIFQSPQFQAWYESLVRNGNRLDDARVISTFVIPRVNFLFSFQLWCNVWIEKEQRHKTNEFFFARNDISTVVAYNRRQSDFMVGDVRVVLCGEYRTAVRNREGLVLECPGGSSFKSEHDPRTVAQQEIFEEIGLMIEDVSRFRYVNSKQMVATLSSHYAHCFAVHLTDDEMDQVSRAEREGKTFGVAADGERTYVRVCKVNDLAAMGVDWAHIGMIYEAILKG